MNERAIFFTHPVFTDTCNKRNMVLLSVYIFTDNKRSMVLLSVYIFTDNKRSMVLLSVYIFFKTNSTIFVYCMTPWQLNVEIIFQQKCMII